MATNEQNGVLPQHYTNKDAHTVHCIFYSLTVFYAYPVRKIYFLILRISFFEIYSSTAYFTEEAECEIFNVHIKICFRQIHSNTLVSIVVYPFSTQKCIKNPNQQYIATDQTSYTSYNPKCLPIINQRETISLYAYLMNFKIAQLKRQIILRKTIRNTIEMLFTISWFLIIPLTI